MELNEKELEQVLGGANPNVVRKDTFRNDELDENDLESVRAGMYNRDLASGIAEQNSSLFRQKMIEELKREKEELEEHKKSM